MNVDHYLGPRESWGFWMLDGSDRDKRQHLRTRLEQAGLRPTWQRMKIGMWVFEPPTKHFTPEDLFRVMQGERPHDRAISLATIYNTLNAFADADLLRMATIDSGKRYYDTNTSLHYHLHNVETGQLIDVPASRIEIGAIPELPDGMEIDQIMVTVQMKPKAP